MNSKVLYTIIAAVAGAVEEGSRNIIRSNGQKKLQKQVNSSQPATVSKDLTVSDQDVQLSLLEDDNVDITKFQISPMSEAEINEWKSLISTLGGETAKTALTASAFNGLLKCDVPLKGLCRIKDNPDAMRGLIINDGKISRHASLSEAGFGNMAPLLAHQCMAAITSQYYQQIITDRLNAIDTKLDNIIKILTAEDRAKLKVAYNRFVELSQKNNYDIADKQIVSEFSGYVEIIKEKYRELLSGIKNLNVSYKWSDKKEAEEKVKALQSSRYFEYLEMVMQAEALSFIASAISIKVAENLGNEEDVKIYAKRMNLDYWNKYVDQFNKIKHDVIKYLELEAKSSLINSKSIKALKDEQLKAFNNVEEAMLNLQRQPEINTVQYIKINDDGSLVKYLDFSK